MSEKELVLRILKLLSALEACGLMQNNRLPDYLHEEISVVVEALTQEILK